MKPFTKRLALVMGLLFTALICMGIVYIDNVANYWSTKNLSGAANIALTVSNRIVMVIDTASGRIGFGDSNQLPNASSISLFGYMPATNATGNGANAATSGRIQGQAGAGGDTLATTTASGGTGGGFLFTGGAGGNTPLATTNQTGGAGGAFTALGGVGGGLTGVATNAATGGAGGALTLTAGAGGSPAAAATNTATGNGGAASLTGGASSSPTGGWARRTGNGGTTTIAGGISGSATRTNSGNGGPIVIQAGNAGGVTTAPGTVGTPGAVTITAGSANAAVAGANTSAGGSVNITAGDGSTGDTNSDSGHVFIAGGSPGSGAVPGNVVLARTSAGTSRGAGVQVGPLITGGSATITNVLGAAASLDFPSTAAGTFSELTISVTGVTSNNVAVALSVPWESAQTGGAFVTFNSNDVIYVRFINNQLASAIDPTPGTFTVVGFRIR